MLAASLAQRQQAFHRIRKSLAIQKLGPGTADTQLGYGPLHLR
jgi:hypothetical protein